MGSIITASDILIYKHGNTQQQSLGVPLNTPLISGYQTADSPTKLACGGSLALYALNAVGGQVNDIFDAVQPIESYTGDTEYRVIYIKNNHPTLTALGLKVYIKTQTTSTDTSVKIGLGAKAAFNMNMTTIASAGAELCTGLGNVTGDTTGYPANVFELKPADEGTAPAGVSFVTAANIASALSLGDLAPGYGKAVWIEWAVNAGAASATSDLFELAITNAVS